MSLAAKTWGLGLRFPEKKRRGGAQLVEYVPRNSRVMALEKPRTVRLQYEEADGKWSFSMQLNSDHLERRVSKILTWFCRATGTLCPSKLQLVQPTGETIELDMPIGDVFPDAESEAYVVPWILVDPEVRADPFALFCAEDGVLIPRPASTIKPSVSLRYLRFLDKAWSQGCALGSTRLAILEAGRRRLAADLSTEVSDEDEYDPPSGVNPKDWSRFAAAREWKHDGDHWLAKAKQPSDAKDALLAYEQAADLLDDFQPSSTWAQSRFMALIKDLDRALRISTAVALLVSGDPQACVDHLRGQETDQEPDLVFCRVEALRRLGFPKLALDVLLTLNQEEQAPGRGLDESQQAVIEAAQDSLRTKLRQLEEAASKNGGRRVKKRW